MSFKVELHNYIETQHATHRILAELKRLLTINKERQT